MRNTRYRNVVIVVYFLFINYFNVLTHGIKIRHKHYRYLSSCPSSKTLLFIRRPFYRRNGGGFFRNFIIVDPDTYDSNNGLQTINHFTSNKAKNKFSDEDGEFLDYYKILSLDKSCSFDDVHTKYNSLNKSLQSLPEVDPKLRSDVESAYKVLSNKSLRSEYDKFYDKFGKENLYYSDDFEEDNAEEKEDDGSEEIQLSIINDDEEPDENLNNKLFGNFFSNLFGWNRNTPGALKRFKTSRRGGLDVSCSAEIDLKTVLLGGSVSVPVRKFDKCNYCNFNESAAESFMEKCMKCNGKGMEHKEKRSKFGFMRTSMTCMKCKGTGFHRLKDCSKCENTGRVLKDSTVKVEVPFNAKVGSVIKVKGKGHSGGFLTRDGDLYVKLKMKENKNEYIEGGRIVTVYNVPYTKAILGEKAKVQTFIGEKEVDIPAYSQQGDEIKVGTYKNMDHIVKLNIQMPKNLSKAELDMLNKIDKS